MSETELIKTAKTEVLDFGVTDDVLRGLVTKYEFHDATKSPEAYAEVVAGIRECRELRALVEGSRKEKKSGLIARGKVIDAEAKRIREILEGVENPMKDSKASVDEEKARIEVERVGEIKGRVKALTVTHVDFDTSLETIDLMLRDISGVNVDETFAEFYHEAEDAKQKSLSILSRAKKSAEDAIEAKRLLDEQKEQQAEEQKRLDAEQEETNRKNKEESDRLAKIADEQAAAQKVIDDRNRDLKEKEDLAAAEERKKKEKEQADAWTAAMLPDKKKLRAFADALGKVKVPSVKSAAANELMDNCGVAIGGIINRIRSHLGNM